jgi:hypothetical protein
MAECQDTEKQVCEIPEIIVDLSCENQEKWRSQSYHRFRQTI